MKKLIYIIAFGLSMPFVNNLWCQEIRFNRVLNNEGNNWGGITAIAQDKKGFIWFTTINKGLQRFDGLKTKSYTNDPRNINSVANSFLLCLSTDSSDNIWIGTVASGLDKFNTTSNTFTHFRHNPDNANSLSNDTVTTMLRDHSGNLWIGTFGGLDQLDEKTGKFIHYRNDPNDPSSLSENKINVIYEDKNGVIWVGCGTNYTTPIRLIGGLNRLDKATGKFTRYFHDPANPGSIADNLIQCIYEDTKGNFWVGTSGDGLHSMNRTTGVFTHYYYNPAHPEKLSGPPFQKKSFDAISFIAEDAAGTLWIGSFLSGINSYDPIGKKITHHGFIIDEKKTIVTRDTATGFSDSYAWRVFTSKDKLFWISTLKGNLFKLNLFKTTIPYYSIKQQESNSLYYEPLNNVLWIATDDGLLRRDLSGKTDKLWEHNPKDDNSLSQNTLYSLRAGDNGKIWLGTVGGGMDEFDSVTEKFIHHKYDPQKPGNIGSNQVFNLFNDHNKNLWAATDSGISRMDKATHIFTNYKHIDKDSTSIIGNEVFSITEDNEYSIWAGTQSGLSRLDTKTGKFRHYLPKSIIKALCVDSKGIVWAGATDALYYYDKAKDQFQLYADQNSTVSITGVLGLTEDNNKNIWVSTSSSIVRIDAARTEVKRYAEAQGVLYNQMGWCDNYIAKDGRLFIGHHKGYYSFYPDKLKDYSETPLLTISAFKLGDKEIKDEPGGILTAPLAQTKEIKLNYNQNIFSFDFFVLDYVSPGDEKYRFMLENYDNNWHNIGADNRAFFFNVPPGNYIFRVIAVNGDGTKAEKNIRIIITPPWWKTWWAYCIYGSILIASGFSMYRLQKQRIVETERKSTQAKELAQAKEIEKAYTDLKATQAQLIQSEKMASLGELTAGIAHEIQNPLNFVNNFSEVSNELIDEMNAELDKGDIAEARAIAHDIQQNLEKINHHGKRADGIVKGMLQHSRTSSSAKEPTNINKLADEYVRLAYHGIRAKDNSFNATLKTDFDETIGNINIVPQDIGRVLLNLINNAFYAVAEKKKNTLSLKGSEDYEPAVSVTTTKKNQQIEIMVSDNGNGIPQNIIDKIFQPFFTTKPTGQGTGLGLSLAYDIVKAHGGELKVETVQGKGTTFIIQLQSN